jgi:DNA-binding XRE family transcriptional regulator
MQTFSFPADLQGNRHTALTSSSGTSAISPLAAAGLPIFGDRQLPPRTTVLDSGRLREARRRRGLSRESLAWQSGLGVTTIRRLESQTSAPCRFRTLARLALALDEPAATLTAEGAPVPPGTGSQKPLSAALPEHRRVGSARS